MDEWMDVYTQSRRVSTDLDFGTEIDLSLN